MHFHILDDVIALGGVESLGADGYEETNFALAVNFSWYGNPGRLAGALDYDAARLTGEQAREYARIYAVILAAMARHPQNECDTLALSETPRFEPLESASVSLHELIADGAAARYPELLLASEKLANALRAKGVGPDVIVGVALHPGVDRLIALLAIVKAGGAYLPLDPDHPAKRLAFVIEDSAIEHVVTRPGVLPAGLEFRHVIDVDSRAEPSMPRVDVRPDNLAYVLYTSGSTGMPKGVAITHRALVNHMLWMRCEYPLTPADVVFQKTPFTFDASVWEFWAPLIAGASLCFAKAGGLQDPAYLIDTIREERVTILQVVPTLLEALLAEPAFRQCRSLRRVFVGGESLSADLVRRFHDALPEADLVNLYGPTETTIDTTSHCFKRGDVERFVPIGKPITNVRAYVLNDALRFVPEGTEGDLYLAGEAVGRGYLGRAAMTAASFVADPHGAPGTRMYRSGDRARWLPGGVLEFRGRADQQIKVRGHRVELGEVEAALASHPNVGQAVASVSDGRLIAYIVARSEVEPAVLREHLRRTLPEPMVPSFFIRMERLPLTPSGKVDRRALPAPSVTDAAAHVEYVDASTEAESAVVAAWQAVLRLPRVGVHDDFFELGGDSIASLRIASRLRQEGWKITPKVILEQHTAARVAAAIERDASASPQAPEVAGPVDLLPAQRAFFEQQHPNPHHWNQSVMLDVPADLSVGAFRQALDAIARRHDAFRIRFGTSGVQAFADQPATIPLELTDDVSRVQASLDITNGPLMRAALFDGHLLLVAHHLVVDAVSWRILLDDLAMAYEQATRSEPIRLPDPTTSLRTWAARLQSHAATADPTPWLSLASTKPVALPARAAANVEADARSIVVTVDDPPARRLNDLLLAALAATITGWTGGDSLWVDVEGHGREDLFDGIDVSRTVGWFTSVFPMALRRSEPVPAVPNNGLDFGVLRHFSPDDSVRARLALLPPREISFNYLGRFDTPASGPFRPSSQWTGPDYDEQAPRRYLIDVNARVMDGRLAIEWTYAGLAFDEHTIRSLSDAFVTHLRSVAAGDEIAALSPLQEGLLFHAMDEEQPGVYVQQLTALLEGSPDPAAFESAWNRAIERHAALRTSFHRRELRRPVQTIHRHARCTPVWLDWRGTANHERSWEMLLHEDRAKGIDIEKAPLMRLTIVRETDHRWRLLWTHHHLILDGWSLPLVMNDVVAFYREESEGIATSMQPAPSHAEFIRWVEHRDGRAGESFWREMLRGFDQPNAFALARPAAAEDARFDAVERVFSS
ncbi:MAG: amino acid adenylation domain-containing protein, partial [Acidobacteriota bacterium]